MEQGGKRLTGQAPGKEPGRKPLISVVTVVLNGEKTLEKTIKSVIDQNWNNIEYIIIDGNSTDNTLGIIRNYTEHIDFWKSEPDMGISDAFNKGISYSTGDFIAFLGSGDWYEPEGVLHIVEHIKPGGEIYAGHACLWTEDGKKIVKLHKSCPERIFQTMRIAHPSTFVSKKVFEQIGGFSTEYRVAMDYDFMLRAKLFGFETVIVNYVITNMLLGGNSRDVTTASKDELKIKNKYLGKKLRHFVWFYAYLAKTKMFSLFNKSTFQKK